jgi:hypothetical protein
MMIEFVLSRKCQLATVFDLRYLNPSQGIK